MSEQSSSNSDILSDPLSDPLLDPLENCTENHIWNHLNNCKNIIMTTFTERVLETSQKRVLKNQLFNQIPIVFKKLPQFSFYEVK